MNYTREQLFSYIKNKGWMTFENGDLNVNIIAVRSDIIDRSEDSFDDVLFLYYKFNDNWVEYKFEITSVPGLMELQNPSFPEAKKNGTAIIVPNQYRGAYKVGYHYNQEALIQYKPIKIYRDNNRNNIIDLDPNTAIEGYWGINIHSTNEYWTLDKIKNWSAGCTVFRFLKEHKLFMDIMKKSSKLYGNSFTLTLIDSVELNQFLLNTEILI